MANAEGLALADPAVQGQYCPAGGDVFAPRLRSPHQHDWPAVAVPHSCCSPCVRFWPFCAIIRTGALVGTADAMTCCNLADLRTRPGGESLRFRVALAAGRGDEEFSMKTGGDRETWGVGDSL